MTNEVIVPLDIQRIFQRRQKMKDIFSEADYVHQEIADRMLERLDLIRLSPKEIIVYGWQTQAETTLLAKRYPDAVIRSIDAIADIHKLPENSAQLVISNLALDWENEPKIVLQAFQRVLVNEGLLLFSTLGPDTAKELRDSFAVVDHYPHVHGFTDMHHIGDALKQLRYDDPVVDMEMLTLAYDDIEGLCHDLKTTASNNAETDRKRGLMTPLQWRQMSAHYDTLKTDNYYPFTLEVIYGHAWKVDRPEKMPQEITVPISAIKK